MGIPIGKVPFKSFQEAASIGSTAFDTCFITSGDHPKATIADHKNDIALEIQQTRPYGYMQFYTPDTRDSIAIEPMSCAPDAFNNKDGLRILDPGESDSWIFSITMR